MAPKKLTPKRRKALVKRLLDRLVADAKARAVANLTRTA